MCGQGNGSAEPAENGADGNQEQLPRSDAQAGLKVRGN